MLAKLNKPIWPNSRLNLTTPLSLALTLFCVIAGVILYNKGLPYEGSALVYMGGGIALSFPYYNARYTVWMTWLVLSCLLPVSIWLQNKGCEAENWIYRAHDTYWFWISKKGEGWWDWTRHIWLGNTMPIMEYVFYPVFSMFQIMLYSLFSHLMPDHYFEKPRRALKWIFPLVYPVMFAGFIYLGIAYNKPNKTDYLYWMVALGQVMTGVTYCISSTYRNYSRTPAYWIWFVGMGGVFLTFWEFFHSCVNHDWVYVKENSMPFAYIFNDAGIPYTSFFGYLTTATTFQALVMLLILKFGHIVIKDRKLVPFSGR